MQALPRTHDGLECSGIAMSGPLSQSLACLVLGADLKLNGLQLGVLTGLEDSNTSICCLWAGS